MKDQVDALAARGLPATFVNSTLTSDHRSPIACRARMRGDVKLLYVAPERFDFGTTAERLRDAGVSLLAVDEAHCISEWGHDFRPSYLRIAQVRERLGWPPTVALTATATPHVRADIVAQLKLEKPTTIITGFDRKNLAYHVRADEDRSRQGRRARPAAASDRRTRGRVRVDAQGGRADRAAARARAHSPPPRITRASTTTAGTTCRTRS